MQKKEMPMKSNDKDKMIDSLDQYLKLYLEHRDLLKGKSAPGFNLKREECFKFLSETGLPAKGSENYEVVDIPEMLAPDYGLNIARIPLDVDVAQGFKCGLPHLSPMLFFMLDDMWAESRNARQCLPEGVEVGPLSSYMKENGEATKYYGRLADCANPIVALNTMLCQEGVFIKVKKGVRVERPLQLVNLLEGTMPMMAVRRLLVVLEEGAELRLLSCDHTSAGDNPLASVCVAEVFVGEASRFEYYDMEESGENALRLFATYVEQQRNSDVLLESFTLHNGMTRNEYHCKFAGRDASLRLYGVGIEGKEMMLDNYSHIRHCAENCRTEELFKYIVEDEAQGAFTGRIYVAPGAMKTEAYQSNRNLVTSDKARMYSKPQLEIYNDDVKCSHGSATGQFDEMQLFYMRSRGLSEEEARLLLKQAFTADVINAVNIPLLRDRIQLLVEKRFEGQDVFCGDCGACNIKG